MDFNFTSQEYNKTFYLKETVSLDDNSMNVYSPAPSAEMTMFYVFLFLIIESLGNFLLLSMITYEKYGMDPQKRTVTNMLLSSICISCMVQNVVAMPIALFHRIFHSFLITLCKQTFLFCGSLKKFNDLGSSQSCIFHVL